jgi:rod shape-determining protein MreC
MRNYKSKRKKIFISTLIVILVLGVLVFTGAKLKNEKNLNKFESLVKDTGVFIGDILYAPIKYTKEKIDVFKKDEKIYSEYLELKKEKENLNMKTARIKELEKENKELREKLDITESLTDYENINTTIVSRNVGTWYNKITINKGSKAGIEKHMAATTNSGLIGYVVETGNYSSTIQLLSVKELKNKISVKIELENGKSATGLLNGYDSKKNVYTIEGISYSGELPKNAYVTTTGLNDKFPSGILIGYVSNTTTDNFDLGKIVEVKPGVDFDNINYVTILKRKAAK